MAFNIKQKDSWDITQDGCTVANVEMTAFEDLRLRVLGSDLIFESVDEVQEFCEDLQMLADMLFAQTKDEDEDEDEDEEEDEEEGEDEEEDEEEGEDEEDYQVFLLLEASKEEMDRVMKLLESVDSKK
jgi:ABC-type Zn2+ transport system substrate-binding protein/surface adhesin